MAYYCGNNRNDPDLVVGAKVIGTRYQCFKKGIGIGLNLPFDPSYAVPYSPIDRTRLYCGTDRKLPDGYTRKGSPSLCLRKGVGVGKGIVGRRKRGDRRSRRRRTSRRKSRRRKSRRKVKRKSRRKKSR